MPRISVPSGRTPVIVGVGSTTYRSGAPVPEPLDMMIQVVRDAARDGGSRTLLKSLSSISVLRGFWPYKSPGRQVADALGTPRVETTLAPPSGNHAQALLNRAARRILAAESDAEAIVSAEAAHTARELRASGRTMDHRIDDAFPPDTVYGEVETIRGAAERHVGITMPPPLYALIENALRYENGISREEHRRRLGVLLEDLSRIAADNPDAWDRTPVTAAEITTESAENRLVADPYRTRFISNWYVDQAAAVILCSLDLALACGVPRDRMVFPYAGTESLTTTPVSERPVLFERPAIGLTGRLALKLAGTHIDEIAHIDLYSCFPAAVQVQARELGLPLDPVPTVTGGMAFAGGPVNSYALHAAVTLVRRLRNEPGSSGLLASVGGVLDKQAVNVLSASPPRTGFRYEDVTAVTEGYPTRPSEPGATGKGTVVSATVVQDSRGAQSALYLADMADGRRTMARTPDTDLIDVTRTDEVIGRSITIGPAGRISLDNG